MLKIERRKSKVNLNEFKSRRAETNDYDKFLNEPFELFSNGELKIVYCQIDEDLTEIFATLQKINYRKTNRTSGMPTISRIFGFQPAINVRRNFCTSASLAVEQPEYHMKVIEQLEIVSRYYQKYNPSLFSGHLNMTKNRILPEWRIDGIPFTSGIINKNNPLMYHFDTGNFQNVWSAMIVFKRDIEGGYLSLPEYGLGIELRHSSLLMFDGQQILHGVTPIKKLTPEALRFSIVYYTLQQMWNCSPVGNEVKKAQKTRTEIEGAERGEDRTIIKEQGKFYD